MQWEQLTAPELARAAGDTGVCVLPVGCLEKHFDHLPLGTDCLVAHRIACEAAAKEPAVVFPPHWFGQINEARIFPGTIAIDPALTLQLLISVCDEIGRNGFAKIIIYNGHGGNIALIDYLCQAMLHRRRPYAVYVPSLTGSPSQEHRKAIEALTTPGKSGHAGETETSMMLAMFPELVKAEAIKGRKAESTGRLAHLPPGRVVGAWYAAYPDHYCGDATLATAEKGGKIHDIVVDSLADYIRAVKNDDVTVGMLGEFHDKVDRVGRSE